jgi:putative transposase
MVPAPDLLQRDFTAERSDLRWVADIRESAARTASSTWPGSVTCTTTRWSVGRWVSVRPPILSSLRWVVALGRRDPSERLVHHADHGWRYTSIEFTIRLVDWGLAGSYGSVGDCYDNAAMESFWATLKKEIRHIHGPLEQFTRSQLRTILFDYIEVFYNRSRHQQGLDDQTPAEVYAASRAA